MVNRRKADKEKIRAQEAEERKQFWKRVDQMLAADCKGSEIAAYFDIHTDTLYDRCERDHLVRWSSYSQRKKERGDILLREAQFHKAVAQKNTQMQIFLGKNRLGQTDRQIIQTEEIKPQKAVLNLPDNGRRKIVKEKSLDE